jgi:hypothetical protein
MMASGSSFQNPREAIGFRSAAVFVPGVVNLAAGVIEDEFRECAIAKFEDLATAHPEQALKLSLILPAVKSDMTPHIR